MTSYIPICINVPNILEMKLETRVVLALPIELLRLTSRNLHSDILAGNQESARAAVALVSTVVEQ